MSPMRLHASNPNLCAELVDYQTPVTRLTDGIECASNYIKLQEDFCIIAQKGSVHWNSQTFIVHNCELSFSVTETIVFSRLGYIFQKVSNHFMNMTQIMKRSIAFVNKWLTVFGCCSALTAEVCFQHCCHWEGEDQAGAVRAGAVEPISSDHDPKALSVTGQYWFPHITYMNIVCNAAMHHKMG